MEFLLDPWFHTDNVWGNSVGRKKKAVHKTTTTDDKRLQSTLKRIGVNTIPGIEEVNIFKDDVVIQFQNPKGEILPCTYAGPWLCLTLSIFLFAAVQASIPANTWVVSGVPQTKSEWIVFFRIYACLIVVWVPFYLYSLHKFPMS